MDIYMPTLSVAGILGFLAPLVIAVINQPGWSQNVRRIVAIAASVVLAVVALLATNALTITDWSIQTILATLFLIIGVAQAAYALIFKPTGVTNKVEQATSKAQTPETYSELDRVDGPDHRKEE